MSKGIVDTRNITMHTNYTGEFRKVYKPQAFIPAQIPWIGRAVNSYNEMFGYVFDVTLSIIIYTNVHTYLRLWILKFTSHNIFAHCLTIAYWHKSSYEYIISQLSVFTKRSNEVNIISCRLPWDYVIAYKC